MLDNFGKGQAPAPITIAKFVLTTKNEEPRQDNTSVKPAVAPAKFVSTNKN
jgi:hypothetical protein